MKKTKKQTVKTIIIMIIISAVLIATYFFIVTKTNPFNFQTTSNMSEVEVLLEKDIQGNYPATPREVIKIYSKIAKSFYEKGIKDDQVKKLADQVRLLFDENLLQNNTYENYLIDLKSEIAEYRDASRSIMSYEIEGSSQVKYWDSEGEKYASIVASYTLKEKSDYTKIFEEFVLKQDAQGNWKILGWDFSDKSEIDSKE